MIQSGSPLDFLARLSLHIPNPNERLERCYGRYSCRVRGGLISQGRDSAAEGRAVSSRKVKRAT